MKLRLSESARRHLQDIRTYTIGSFGERQWLVYSGALEAGFSTLRRFPQIGNAHEDLQRGYLAFRVREHWICYQLSGDTIVIHGIVRYFGFLDQ